MDFLIFLTVWWIFSSLVIGFAKWVEGKSFLLWTFLSLILSPVICGIIILKREKIPLTVILENNPLNFDIFNNSQDKNEFR